MNTRKSSFLEEILEDSQLWNPTFKEKRQALPIRIYGQQRFNNFHIPIYNGIKKIPIKRVFPELQDSNTLSIMQVAKSINAYYNLVSKVIILTLYESAIDAVRFARIRINIYVQNENFPVKKWKKELNQIEQQLINKRFNHFGEGDVVMNSTIQEILEIEKEKLKPLDDFYYNPDADQPNFLANLQESLAELQEQIKGDFKNSNRITYKLMQDFQQQLEDFGQMSDEDQESKVEEIKIESMKKIHNMKLVAIEIFDMLDLVYQATLKVNEAKWSNEIEKAITRIMSLLEAHGIVEIPVMGQLLEGKTMECIGTVSQKELQEPIEKYQVYAVHQRGFMDKDTGKILRKASVTSVL